MPEAGSIIKVFRPEEERRMKFRTTVAFVCYVLVMLVSLVFAGLYLGRSEFMPYHAVAIGIQWAQLKPEFQTLFLALLRVCGGGWLAATVAMGILVFIPFRRNESWTTWAVPLVGLSAAIPTLYATLLVKAKTPASPPWYGAAGVIVLLIVGFALSFPWKKKGSGKSA
jgi:multisubunit Na+/H+ antiporter MnhB subunit